MCFGYFSHTLACLSCISEFDYYSKNATKYIHQEVDFFT